MRKLIHFEDSGFDDFTSVTSAHLEEIREGYRIWRKRVGRTFSKKGHI